MTIEKPVVAILHTWCGPTRNGKFYSRSAATIVSSVYSYTHKMNTGVCDGSQQSRDEMFESLKDYFTTHDMNKLQSGAKLVEFERQVSSKDQL